MEKIAALRLFVPLTVLLIGVLTLVACKIHDASYSEENAIFLWRRQGTTQPPLSIGASCIHSATSPQGDCSDPHAECATNNTCVCSVDYVAESSNCKAKVDTPCEDGDCMHGADCVARPTTNSPAPTAHQPGVTTSSSPTQPSTTTQPTTTLSPSTSTTSPSTATPSAAHTHRHTTQLSTIPPHSADKSTDAPTGRRKRQHADRVCRCDTDHYTTKFRTCAPRIALTQPCEPLEYGHSPCVQPNLTACHGIPGSRTCQCTSDFFSSDGTTCTPRLKAGSRCIHGDVCVTNATCTVPHGPPNYPTVPPGYNECTCEPNYFRDNDGLCQPRVIPGKSCTIPAHGEDPCVENAHCHNNICQCPQDHFKQTASKCLHLFEPGEPGCVTDHDKCVANAECIHDYCECKSGFFDNSTIHLCQLRKAPMSSCLASVECVPNAACRSSVCTCEEHYYADPQRCNPRLSFNYPCHVSDECLLNGECIQGHCLCNDKSFNNENTNCPLTLKVGEPCNWYNNDPRQCQSNSTCVFRPSDSHPVCGCDIDHFFNSQYCVKRALAGDPCPYETSTSMGLSMAKDEFDKQCVENAECDYTYNVCHCKSGRYNRAGRCPLQIAVDGYCDPWTDNIDQCMSNAQCVYGRCVKVGVTVGPLIG